MTVKPDLEFARSIVAFWDSSKNVDAEAWVRAREANGGTGGKDLLIGMVALLWTREFQTGKADPESWDVIAKRLPEAATKILDTLFRTDPDNFSRLLVSVVRPNEHLPIMMASTHGEVRLAAIRVAGIVADQRANAATTPSEAAEPRKRAR